MTKKKSENSNQLWLDIMIVLPTPPVETPKQELKKTTAWTPLPSIVSCGYDVKPRHGINWAHYENMWKLFALEEYFIQGPATQQQEKDRQDLIKAIEKVGNAKYKSKHMTAQEIIARDSKIYMCYGKRFVNAIMEKDPIVSNQQLEALYAQIPDTGNDKNAIQLRKVSRNVTAIMTTMKSRYNSR